MNKKSLIISSVAAFVIAGGIGYGAMEALKTTGDDAGAVVETAGDAVENAETGSSDNNEDYNGNVADVSEGVSTNEGHDNGKLTPGSNISTGSNTAEGETSNQNATSNQIRAHLSASSPKKNGTTWSFTVRCSGIPTGTSIHYELWGSGKIASSSNGVFSNIPDSPTGRYKVCVVDEGSQKNLGAITVSGFKTVEPPKMSASAFQSLLLNRRDHSLLGGRNKMVARNISFSYTGIHEGENRPDDVQSIRDKILFGKWSSATVVSVGYDENGKINSAVIKPEY